MATSGITRRGMFRISEIIFQGATAPANFFIGLVTAATAPTTLTVTLSQLTEIAQGAGYSSGGYSIARNSTDWVSVTESGDDAITQMRDFDAVASGGALPLSGADAAYIVLLGPHATPASREVWAWWSLKGDRHVSDGQSMTFDDVKAILTAIATTDP